MPEPRLSDIEASAVRQASAGARTLADAMPRLILEARRVASTVIHGLHGRRRAGPGENFWQYRRFMSGESASNVDWRRSARDDHLYVREREWEASHTVWIWPDRSPSMAFASALVADSKLERALVFAFALAEVRNRVAVRLLEPDRRGARPDREPGGQRRPWPCGAGRRSGRGKLPLFGPRRIHRAGRLRQHHRR